MPAQPARSSAAADTVDTAEDAPWPELVDLAESYGIATRYRDWREQDVTVTATTLVAVLRAFDVDARDAAACRRALAAREQGDGSLVSTGCLIVRRGPDPLGGYATEAGVTVALPRPRGIEAWVELEAGGRRECRLDETPGAVTVSLPPGLPVGWHTLRLHLPGAADGSAEAAEHEIPVAVAPWRLEPPAGLGDKQLWGYTLQLHALRSRRSWTMGDLADLAELAAIAGDEHGAGFLVVNPLHAGSPVAPADPSPYLPVSRRFFDPIHLRVEEVLEYAYVEDTVRDRIRDIARDLRERHDLNARLDRDDVWRAKREALRLLYTQPLSAGRAAAYRGYLRRQGEALRDFATWCALCERHGASWPAWPAPLRQGPGAVAEDAVPADEVDFYCWLQWQLDGQLEAAARSAADAGMPLGIVHDLAVGSRADGADTWTSPEVYAAGVTTGAPPDGFNQLGQTWGSRPWRPDKLAESGYAAYRAMLEAVLRHADGLRMDHVMGLFRLWWVPDGMPASAGTYVDYDHDAMLAILAIAAHQADTLVIGEDLGTVEPRVRTELASWGVFGTSVLWFEADEQGAPLPPAAWRTGCLATITTHDLPPTASYLSGDHVELRRELDLLTRPVEAERAEARESVEGWLTLLRREGLVQPGDDEQRVTEALHRLLRWSPARLVGVWLPDAVGDRRPHNLPGTTDEQYPNWRLPLADADGAPVLIDDLSAHPRLRSLVRALRRG